MSFFRDWVDRVLGRPTQRDTARAVISAKEEELIRRNALRKGISPQRMREQAVRRAAIGIEAESYRRGNG